MIENSTYLYLGDPFVVNSGPRGAHLRGSDEIENFALFLERNQNLSFIDYKDYKCCDNSSSRARRTRQDRALGTDPEILLVKESISIISPALALALQTLARVALVGITHPVFEVDVEFPSPYLWWYHGRDNITEFDGFLEEFHQEHIDLFQEFVDHRLGDTWAEVDALLEEGKISAKYIDYLFVSYTTWR